MSETERCRTTTGTATRGKVAEVSEDELGRILEEQGLDGIKELTKKYDKAGITGIT